MLNFLRNATADVILVVGITIIAIIGIPLAIIFWIFNQPWITPLMWITLIALVGRFVFNRTKSTAK